MSGSRSAEGRNARLGYPGRVMRLPLGKRPPALIVAMPTKCCYGAVYAIEVTLPPHVSNAGMGAGHARPVRATTPQRPQSCPCPCRPLHVARLITVT